jgi:hypothetical protein
MEPTDFPPTFHPITVAWFRRFGEPSPPQRLGWPLILSPMAANCSRCCRADIMGTSLQQGPPLGGQG